MQVYGSRLSVADAGYLLLSTLISVSVHEFGHSIAAARSLFSVLLFSNQSHTLIES
jgi:S2P endopeptidase